MGLNHGLAPGQIITNNELCDLFKCSPQGGMRRSHATNTLVIITDHIKSIYHDRWEAQTLHYTGMGQDGDQELGFLQNKTLAESNSNGVEVYFFEVFRRNEYTLVGQVQLVGDPYQEPQLDKSKNERLVWVFPLNLVSGQMPPAISEDVHDAIEQERLRKIRRMTDNELLQRAKRSRPRAGTRNVTSKAYERDPYVSEFAKRRAKGRCQLCQQDAPFCDSKGRPFLESHHIVWLSRDGEDSIENAVALCPNCHRKMHVLDRAQDRAELSKL